jgi:hypothetical protein
LVQGCRSGPPKTPRPPRGLLKIGAARCRALNPSLDEAWEQRLLGELGSCDLDDTLSAAEKVSRKLLAPTGGEFTLWLRESVGALQLREATVLEALRDLQVPLATTNYDDLLERVTGIRPATWRDQAKVFHFVRDEERFILTSTATGTIQSPWFWASAPTNRSGRMRMPKRSGK